MLRWIMVALIATLIAGCSTPYDPPDVVGKKNFPGAATLAKDVGRVRVVMAHGMCSGFHKYYGKNNWVSQRAGLIAETIGDDSFTPSDLYIPARQYPGQGAESAVQRVDMNLTGQDGIIYDMSLLLWGDPFDDARDQIDRVTVVDSSGDAPKRAQLNEMLKETLMNDCFVDAVAYTGTRGDVVRKNMRQAICELIGGRISSPNNGRIGETVKCTGISAPGDVPVMLVPESLGAKVVMDAFLALDDGTGGTRKAEALGPVKAIHLATHQLPLLDTGLAPKTVARTERDAQRYQKANAAVTSTNREQVDSTLSDFLQVLGNTRRSRNDPKPLSLVVYYDPNDMFGYPLTDKYFEPGLRVTLTNVIVSNAPTYFGIATNPLQSHRNTARPGIGQIIVQGSDAID